MGKPQNKVSTLPTDFADKAQSRSAPSSRLPAMLPTKRKVDIDKLQAKFDYQIPMIEKSLYGDQDLLVLAGSAGTGKTFIGTCGAIRKLQAGEVEKIALARPAVEAGEQLGFLPGDMKDKVDPFMRPFYDAFNKLGLRNNLDAWIAEGKVEILTIAHLLGRDLEDTAVVVDEAQMLNEAQLFLVATRLGEGSSLTLCGDHRQTFLKHPDSEAFPDFLKMIEKRKLGEVIRIPYDAPSCRTKLVQEIQRAREEEFAQRRAGNNRPTSPAPSLTPPE